jgi:hypothetical protein
MYLFINNRNNNNNNNNNNNSNNNNNNLQQAHAFLHLFHIILIHSWIQNQYDVGVKHFQ